jgi:uncharacterized protein
MTPENLRRLSRFIPLVLATLLAGACASTSPPMRFYLLSPVADVPTTGDTLGDLLVVVGPLQLPGYLDRPQLVLRQADGQLSLREFDRWAEPLDGHLTSTVTANLVRLTGSPRVVAFPLPARASADLRILARVIRFDGDASGLATLEIQCSVSDARGEPRIPVRIDTYRSQASGADPAAMVVALSEVVAQFSRQLAGELLAIGPDIGS